jgi:hypothetical protein
VKPTDLADPAAPSQHDEPRLDAGPKKAYVKPSFLHERVFETMALACGKVNNTQAQCKGNKKNS